MCVAAAVMVGAGVLWAQTAENAAERANVSGRWVGAFDTVRVDGSVEKDSAYFMLKQDGAKITGGAGQSEQKVSPIADGTIDGDSVRFAVVVNPQMTVQFDLHPDGNHLRGSATGVPLEQGARVVVDVVRWQEGSATPTVIHAQDGLFTTVVALDTKLFDAYNHCDLTTMGALVADDLEFYHDKTGLMVGKQPFLDAIKNNICGKTQRTLVAGSLEVYPLKGYGAVEIGVHRFHHPEHPEMGVGEAKFVTVWRNKDGVWAMTRAISFDHENVK
jgi:hypothetical protein